MVEPYVTVIIPVRNEELYISTCLDDILKTCYSLAKLEILVVDGVSDDNTRNVVCKYADKYSCIKLLDNPEKTVPFAMNIGIQAAKGQVILRMDAHAMYDEQYIPSLIKWLIKLKADNVGGVCITLPANNNSEAIAVASIMSHPFGVGNSLFRTGTSKAPCEVDTVPFGCYRREVFDKIGFYDEQLVRNQDDELNARLIQGGGKIYLIPMVEIKYIARESLSKMRRMFYQYGYFKPLVGLKLGKPATSRQLVPPIFVLALLGGAVLAVFAPFFFWPWLAGVILYMSINITLSIKTARKKNWKSLCYLIIGFFYAHIFYGFGYLNGVWDFILMRKHLKGKISEVHISR